MRYGVKRLSHIGHINPLYRQIIDYIKTYMNEDKVDGPCTIMENKQEERRKTDNTSKANEYVYMTELINLQVLIIVLESCLTNLIVPLNVCLQVN